MSFDVTNSVTFRVQNSTISIGDNETTTILSITAHPDVHFYQTVYGMFIIVMLGSSILRGLFFVKVTPNWIVDVWLS